LDFQELQAETCSPSAVIAYLHLSIVSIFFCKTIDGAIHSFTTVDSTIGSKFRLSHITIVHARTRADTQQLRTKFFLGISCRFNKRLIFFWVVCFYWFLYVKISPFLTRSQVIGEMLARPPPCFRTSSHQVSLKSVR
jgi:hypothetical protein